ncbi:MAG: hypothetical protein R3287_15420, partial [Anderseniella sp.]|nr:hypothetical protein [Anderseniella sp.]
TRIISPAVRCHFMLGVRCSLCNGDGTSPPTIAANIARPPAGIANQRQQPAVRLVERHNEG